MALWGGRFTQAADTRFKDFNDSLRFDYRLAEQDIVGSIAWSKALVSVNVLTEEEQQKLELALNELKLEVMENPKQILRSDAEDIHSWVEPLFAVPASAPAMSGICSYGVTRSPCFFIVGRFNCFIKSSTR